MRRRTRCRDSLRAFGMSDLWPTKPVGPRVSELDKSTLPAGLAEEHGDFPFYCSSPQVRRINRAITSIPSILMGTGGVATVHLGQGSFAYSTDTWAFTVSDPSTDLGFLYRQLEHRLPEIDYAGFGGSGLRHLQKEYVRRLMLAVPPLTQQIQIARILDTLDATIRESEAIVAKLEAIQQGLLNDLLTRGIDQSGQMRPPSSEAQDLYTQSPLGLLPHAWKARPLSTLCDGRRPITYGVLKPGPYTEGGIPLLQIQDVIHGEIDFSIVHRIPPRLDEEYSRTRIYGGEIVISLVGTIGRCAQIPYKAERSNLHRNLGLIAIPPTECPEFFLTYLLSRMYKDQLASETFGSTQALLNLSNLRSSLIPVPPISERRAIAAVAAESAARLRAETQGLQKLRQARVGLVDDLLTGRIPVTQLLSANQLGGA